MTSARVADMARRGGRAWRRDDIALIASVATIVAAAWVYVVVQAQQMAASSAREGMSIGMAMPQASDAWSPGVLASQFAIWMAMMVAMMLPTAIPMTLIYTAVARKASHHRALAATALFVTGYAAMWLLFSAAAMFAQVALQQGAHLSALMALRSTPAACALLIAAGAYQLTPLKRACLRNCRSPVHFLSRHWQQGSVGAGRMGALVGAFCVGCCWVIMALLFVGGAMNLLWAAAIAIFVLMEKVAPFGVTAGRLAAPMLVGAGILLIVF